MGGHGSGNNIRRKRLSCVNYLRAEPVCSYGVFHNQISCQRLLLQQKCLIFNTESLHIYIHINPTLAAQRMLA